MSDSTSAVPADVPEQTIRGDLDLLMEPQNWPAPSWLEEPSPPPPKRRLRPFPTRERSYGYQHFLSHQLRTRYITLEADFRGIVGAYRRSPDADYIDSTVAEQISGFLTRARILLEARAPDTSAASTTLDLVDRNMVWVTPPEYQATRLTRLTLIIDTLPSAARTLYSGELHRLREQNGEWESYRSLVSAATGFYYDQALADAISTELQLRRLRRFRWAGLGVLTVFLAGSALASARTALTEAPYELPLIPASLSDAWLTAAAVALVGAVAAFLSGLLQARDSTVDLVDYRSSIVLLQLRPVIGAIVSVVLFILLSWNLVPGIQIESRGTLFFIAFLAGFSERYFLRILDLQVNNEQTIAKHATPIAAAGTGPAS